MNNHQLTEEAQADRDDFDRDMADYGCTCFISPPCGYCTHPGNPLNQEEDDCWKPDVIEKPVTKSRNKREGWYAGKTYLRKDRVGAARHRRDEQYYGLRHLHRIYL